MLTLPGAPRSLRAQPARRKGCLTSSAPCPWYHNTPPQYHPFRATSVPTQLRRFGSRIWGQGSRGPESRVQGPGSRVWRIGSRSPSPPPAARSKPFRRPLSTVSNESAVKVRFFCPWFPVLLCYAAMLGYAVSFATVLKYHALLLCCCAAMLLCCYDAMLLATACCHAPFVGRVVGRVFHLRVSGPCRAFWLVGAYPHSVLCYGQQHTQDQYSATGSSTPAISTVQY
eukprot:3766181-Rhodomonas_salina.1